ncbi:hypothetical protein C4559_05390 [Candidatus Microgenomates bacterium]|nr:MAG: hypothetical protein C4559_05390 [Candidatus Microgenomates bacterium]
MSKRTLALIIGLIVVTAVLLAIALSPEKPQENQPISQKTPIVTKAPVVQTNLFFTPSPLIVSSSSGSINVNINTGENKATAVQLELTYDPKALTNIDIKPGNYFENPIVLLKNVDDKNGRITYAIAISPTGAPKKGEGIVATITFTSLLGPGQKTEITPLPKTMATATGETMSVLKKVSGATIISAQKGQ